MLLQFGIRIAVDTAGADKRTWYHRCPVTYCDAAACTSGRGCKKTLTRGPGAVGTCSSRTLMASAGRYYLAQFVLRFRWGETSATRNFHIRKGGSGRF